jgi:fatty-acyl-CoA synthase
MEGMHMKLGNWMTAKDILRINAFKYPNKIGIKDLNKQWTFKQWDDRACRLANALADLGMKKGDRFAVLAYNCVEWMEFYGAAAKGGFICVPIMFRLAAVEMEYNINHSECKVFIVQDQWVNFANGFKDKIPGVERFISFAIDNPRFDGYIQYEEMLAKASPAEPATKVDAADLWVIMYTGGTTGKPKGVMKTHASLFAEYFIMIYDHQFDCDDCILLVMPCCHVNSLFYSFTVTWVGGTVMPYNMVSFNPENLLKTFADHGVTFTSLVPTHYIMMLALPRSCSAPPRRPVATPSWASSRCSRTPSCTRPTAPPRPALSPSSSLTSSSISSAPSAAKSSAPTSSNCMMKRAIS